MKQHIYAFDIFLESFKIESLKIESFKPTGYDCEKTSKRNQLPSIWRCMIGYLPDWM